MTEESSKPLGDSVSKPNSVINVNVNMTTRSSASALSLTMPEKGGSLKGNIAAIIKSALDTPPTTKRKDDQKTSGTRSDSASSTSEDPFLKFLQIQETYKTLTFKNKDLESQFSSYFGKKVSRFFRLVIVAVTLWMVVAVAFTMMNLTVWGKDFNEMAKQRIISAQDMAARPDLYCPKG
jgi:hypothetical protein